MNDQPTPTVSTAFRKMADAIDHNAEKSVFGGAAVIVPPGGHGVPVELLMLDGTADVAQFYSTLLTRLQIVVEGLKSQQRQGYGPR